jgi:hypothetical protein
MPRTLHMLARHMHTCMTCYFVLVILSFLEQGSHVVTHKTNRSDEMSILSYFQSGGAMFWTQRSWYRAQSSNLIRSQYAF